MKTSIMYTLDDGTTWTSKEKMLKHLDNEVEKLVREIAELFAHKNASEIGVEIAHRGGVLMHKFADLEKYYDKVRTSVSRIELVDHNKED